VLLHKHPEPLIFRINNMHNNIEIVFKKVVMINITVNVSQI